MVGLSRRAERRRAGSMVGVLMERQIRDKSCLFLRALRKCDCPEESGVEKQIVL